MQSLLPLYPQKRTFKTDQLSDFYVRCFGPIFWAGAAHVVLLGSVRIVQRKPDFFPDLGCVLQGFSDERHRRMTTVSWFPVSNHFT